MDYLDYSFLNNPVSAWLTSLTIIIGATFFGKFIFWFTKKYLKGLAEKSKSKLDDIIISSLQKPIVFSIVTFAIWYGIERLHFSVSADATIGKAFHFILVINVTWLIARAFDGLVEQYIIPFVNKTDNELDEQILPIVRKIVRNIIWVVGVTMALNNAGYDVGALIAGLGIGGLALALAAQDTVKNFFGGIMIFLDKPFKITDRIKIESYDGFVQEIGLRSTRIKTLEGRIVTVPNSTFSDNSVENVTWEPSRKVVSTLGLTYDTTPDKMELALSILKSIVDEYEPVLEENNLISFNSFGDFSMNILFIYYIKKEGDIFETQTKINLRILKDFNENGLEFAFPTQTIYKKEMA